jgi:hypothetical protein
VRKLRLEKPQLPDSTMDKIKNDPEQPATKAPDLVRIRFPQSELTALHEGSRVSRQKQNLIGGFIETAKIRRMRFP